MDTYFFPEILAHFCDHFEFFFKINFAILSLTRNAYMLITEYVDILEE